MSTYTQILYQIVFSTKNRERTLSKPNRTKLFKYISGIIEHKKCHLYRINGVDDHLHIITHLHPSIALSILIKDIKLASNNFIKDKNLLTTFRGWQEGYSAFTYSIKAKDKLIEYVKNQEEHHKLESFIDELKGLLKEHNVIYDPKFLI